MTNILTYHLFEGKDNEERNEECEVQMQHLNELCLERGVEIFKQEIMLGDAYDIIMMFHIDPKLFRNRKSSNNTKEENILASTPEYFYAVKKPHESAGWYYYLVTNGKNSEKITSVEEVINRAKERQKEFVV